MDYLDWQYICCIYLTQLHTTGQYCIRYITLTSFYYKKALISAHDCPINMHPKSSCSRNHNAATGNPAAPSQQVPEASGLLQSSAPTGSAVPSPYDFMAKVPSPVVIQSASQEPPRVHELYHCTCPTLTYCVEHAFSCCSFSYNSQSIPDNPAVHAMEQLDQVCHRFLDWPQLC